MIEENKRINFELHRYSNKNLFGKSKQEVQSNLLDILWLVIGAAHRDDSFGAFYQFLSGSEKSQKHGVHLRQHYTIRLRNNSE